LEGVNEYHAVKQTTLPKCGFSGGRRVAVGERGARVRPTYDCDCHQNRQSASWQGAVRARDESGGEISAVSDEEIRAAHSYLAGREGIFVEPASAASVAGLLKKVRAGKLERGQTIVCVLTGNGLKDTDFALEAGFKVETLPAEATALAKALDI